MLHKFYILLICLIMIVITGKVDAEVKIAILDSGCNIGYKEGASFVDNTIVDLNGHGTAIAKIIKQINPDAELYIAKVFSQSAYSLDVAPFVKGIEWAVWHRVDIINISWQLHKDEKLIHEAIQKAHRSGIIIVASAGTKNDFLNDLVEELCKYSHRPDDISIGVKYPAKYDEVIAVGAISRFLFMERHEKCSPIGAEIEFVCDGSYGSQKGTSFATARASAIISKIKSDCIGIDGIQLREILKLCAHDLGKKGRDAKFGYGKLEYRPEVIMEIAPSVAMADNSIQNRR